MSSATDLPEKESFITLTFTYGDPGSPSFAYYTNWTENYGIYAATPAMKVALPQNIGLFQDQIATIELPTDAFVDRLCDGLPHSPVTVQITEITRPMEGGPSSAQRVLFLGRVTTTVRNSQGRNGSRLIKARTEKEFLDVPLGVPADYLCAHAFDENGCNGGSPAAGEPTHASLSGGTVQTIEGRKVTLAGSPTISYDHYFTNGYIERDGLRLRIRDYDAAVDDKVLWLVRQPPSEWLGQAVSLKPGCRKTITDCRDDHDNEANFAGYGMGIPKWHPVIEDSP